MNKVKTTLLVQQIFS